MTSEILILNKKSIVLAADSAQTIGEHVYQGIEKIFELSKAPAMAMMTYNNGEFMDIPLSTLIKDYRHNRDFSKLKNMENILNDFIIYLEENTKKFSKPEIKIEINEFKKYVIKEIKKYGLENLKNRYAEYETDEILPFLKNECYDIDFYEINGEYGIPIEILKKFFSNYLKFNGSCIVLTGFNDNEYFPSFIEFNLILNYEGNLIFEVFNKETNIDVGAIIPFAQKEVIETFLNGIDETVENTIIDYWYDTIEFCFNEFIKEIKKDNPQIKIDKINLNQIINENLADQLILTLNDAKNDIEEPIFESVRYLSDDELVKIAKILIKITSIKIKLLKQLETVDEEISIAIITKSNGLEWQNGK